MYDSPTAVRPQSEPPLAVQGIERPHDNQLVRGNARAQQQLEQLVRGSAFGSDRKCVKKRRRRQGHDVTPFGSFASSPRPRNARARTDNVPDHDHPSATTPLQLPEGRLAVFHGPRNIAKYQSDGSLLANTSTTDQEHRARSAAAR